MNDVKEKKNLKRIGELTENVGPESFWGSEIPLYKLKETDFLFQSDMEIKEFASMKGANGRYVHIRVQSVFGIGPNGETGDIAVSTGAKSVLARLDFMVENGIQFPVLGRFKRGPEGPNQWFDLE